MLLKDFLLLCFQRSMAKKKIKTEETEKIGINVTPLVDISFSLVVFCLLTMNLILTSGIKVTESQAGAAKGKSSLKENIYVRLSKGGKIYIGEKRLSRWELFKELTRELPKTRDKMVIISADDEVICENVVEVLDIAKQSGAKRLALLRRGKSISLR